MDLDIAAISYLPEPLNSEINRLKKFISKKFNTQRAMDWEPHITIANRVMVPEEKQPTIFAQTQKYCERTKPIELRTTALHILKVPNSPFENPYGIFIGLEPNERLTEFHNYIQNNVFSKLIRPSYSSNSYVPHVTLAYNDLVKEYYEEAKEYFGKNPINVEHNFVMDAMQLATQNETGTWSTYKIIS